MPRQPWAMCDRAEAMERQKNGELSDFEATLPTAHLHYRKRVASPFLCVKKYRRSAAGGGVSKGSSRNRSLSHLEATVDHLLNEVFANRSSHPLAKSRSLFRTVSFVDDRLRAVQVDLLAHRAEKETAAAICSLQGKIVKYHVLIGYLLSDAPISKFEHAFCSRALRTALSAFFESMSQLDALRDDTMDLIDEIMSYSTLLHTSGVIISKEKSYNPLNAGGSRFILMNDSEGGFAVSRLLFSLVNRGGDSSKRQNGGRREEFPKWKWSLKIAAGASLGNYVQVLNLLTENNHETKENSFAFCDKFMIYSRCCMFPALPAIRVDSLRQLNKSLGKGEPVSRLHLQQLLCTSSSESALSFCQMIGLPLKVDAILFKAAPISIEDGADVKFCLREDSFVFRSLHENCTDEDNVVVPAAKFILSIIS